MNDFFLIHDQLYCFHNIDILFFSKYFLVECFFHTFMMFYVLFFFVLLGIIVLIIILHSFHCF